MLLCYIFVFNISHSSGAYFGDLGCKISSTHTAHVQFAPADGNQASKVSWQSPYKLVTKH